MAGPLLAGWALAMAGCEVGPVAGDVGPPVRAPEVAPLPPPWTSEALREVVELQRDRDGEALRDRLASSDPDVRARAAFALASVQDTAAVEGLAGLLDDPEPAVRREAAFALGATALPDGGAPLVDALRADGNVEVRVRLLEALGRRGDPEVLDPLLALEPGDGGEEAARILALGRLGLRGDPPPELVDLLFERLTHEDDEVRENASRFFARREGRAAWRDRADELRRTLDRREAGEPAAGNLVLALAGLEDPADRDRLMDLLVLAEDWRVRVNAARALGSPPLLQSAGTRDALFRAVFADPSLHAATAAARSLSGGFLVPRATEVRMERWILDGPMDRWPTHVPFLQHLARSPENEPTVLAWARRAQRHGSGAALVAAALAAGAQSPEAVEILERMAADDPDPLVRASAVAGLGRRWTLEEPEEDELETTFRLLSEALAEGEPPEAARAAEVALQPPYLGLNGPSGVVEAAAERIRTEERPGVLASLFQALAPVAPDEARALAGERLDHPDERVRAVARWIRGALDGEAEAAVPPTPPVDWDALEALGPEPTLHLETERGDLVLRLVPTRAPLTVQTLARLAEAGELDGVPVHRVVPGALLQTGDVVRGDGAGSPGFVLRSEYTGIPFQRGVAGMAATDRDTEDSQFFLVHTRQPELDGFHTAFGWVESGHDAMDRLVEGDRVLRARVGAGDGV